MKINNNENVFMTMMYDLYEEVYIDPMSDTYNLMAGKKKIRKHLSSIKRYIQTVQNKNALSFEDLWNFANYLRAMEISFFYKNTLDKPVCCDSEYDGIKRILIFKPLFTEGVTIKLDLVEDDNAIDIIIKRDFGKKVTNIFNIVNGQVKFNNTTEVVLMNTVNIAIRDIVVESLSKMVKLIASGGMYNPKEQ